jgi:hypothetical protein
VETLCLLIDTAALLLVIYYSWKNDKLPPGAPEQGFFRMAQTAVRKAAKSRPGDGRRQVRGL